MAKKVKSVMKSYKSQYNKSQKQWNKMTGFPTSKKKNFYDKYTMSSKSYKPKKSKPISVNSFKHYEQTTNTSQNNNGCYIATCVYGSYDCPEVWTLSRFRDMVLDMTWYGKLFIKCYYAISPTIVRLLGNRKWFKTFWRSKLDDLVVQLNCRGIKNTEYKDI